MNGAAESDARAYPVLPAVGVGAVVFEEGSVLLVRRGREPMLGQWSLPGGALQLGETLWDGVAREVLEETGLRVEPIEMVATLDCIVPDEDGRVRYHYVLVDFRCRLLSEAATLRAGDDAAAAEWVLLDRLQDAEYRMDEVTRDVIGRAGASSRETLLPYGGRGVEL